MLYRIRLIGLISAVVLATMGCCGFVVNSCVHFYSTETVGSPFACMPLPDEVQPKTQVPPAQPLKMQINEASLPVAWVSQLPELPTGCEITALTTVLHFFGFPVDKVTLCQDYLTWGYEYVDPFVAFLGNPFSTSNGFGCYAPPIVEAAQRYLNAVGATGYQVQDISGTDFDKLLSFVAEGDPIIVWTTCETRDTYPIYSYMNRNWYSDSHCVVLTGFTQDTCLCADPLYGITEYDRNRMQEKYEFMYSQAVRITKTPS